MNVEHRTYTTEYKIAVIEEYLKSCHELNKMLYIVFFDTFYEFFLCYFNLQIVFLSRLEIVYNLNCHKRK